jgi:hypothetical protein
MNMSGDDPIEHGISVAMTGVAAMSRVAEILIRQAQEAKARAAADSRANAEELQLQLAARAETAEAYYAAAAQREWLATATTEEIAAVVHGVHAWAEVDEQRFGPHAEQMREHLKAAFGVDLREAYEEQRNAEAIADLARFGMEEARSVDGAASTAVDATQELETVAVSELAYDAPWARVARSEAMVVTGAGATEAVKARTVSDQLNAHDPSGTAAAAASGKGRRPGKAAVRTSRRQTAQQRGR